MFGTRHEVLSHRTYSFPQTKVKNIFCVRCKRHFFARAFSPLQGLLPLILRCGHIMCDQCSKSDQNNACPTCEINADQRQNEETLLPLNIYAVGLMVISYNSNFRIDDKEIAFNQPIKLNVHTHSTQGLCHECGLHATVRCPQCVALYCSICYTKIHGKALKSHSKMPLIREDDSDRFIMRSICTETCNEPLEYYCNDCNLCSCPHCILQLHPKHNYIPLKNKNQELLDEFEAVCNQVAEAQARIRSAQRKIKDMQKFPANLQHSEAAETTITQHFALLHGILQNIEDKILSELYQQRNYLDQNLKDISMQLEKQADELDSALVLVNSVKGNLNRVDLQELIRNFKALADIPCHLVQDVIPADEKVVFNPDKSIITALENHCKLELPPPSGFNLLPTKLVPEHHKIEPLPEEPVIPKLVCQPTKSVKSSSPDAKLNSEHSDRGLDEGTAEMVRVTHIIDPDCFYVQKVASLSKITELERALAAQANIAGSVSSEVTLKKTYLIQRAIDKQWYRGYVTDIKVPNKIFDVFLIDYGITEEDVPITRMKPIEPQYAALPRLAIKCALYNTVAKNDKWNELAIEDFKKLVTNQSQISMLVINVCGDTYYVDLCSYVQNDIVSNSVKERMIYLKHANRVTPAQLMRMNPRSVRKYYTEHLRMDKYTIVEVLNVDTPSSIYVRKAKQCPLLYDKLQEELTTEYEQNTSMGFIHAPEEGLVCAAQYVNGYWYRAIICDKPSGTTVKVFYVDVGITVDQNYDTIRALQDRFLTLRTQAIKIGLHRIVPPSDQKGQWSQDAINLTKKMLKSDMIVKIVPYQKEEGFYGVTLLLCMETTASTNSINLGSLLVNQGLAEYVAKSDSLPAHTASKKKLFKNKKKPKLSVLLSDYDGIRYNDISHDVDESKESEDPFRISVFISRVESPDCIYVSNKKCHESYCELRSDMLNFYKRFHSKTQENWTKDTICAVYSEKDKQYCRAKILDVKSPNEVTVFFYDLGIQEIVPMKNIQHLHPNYSNTPALVFKIKLAGLLPPCGTNTWPSLSCEILKEIIDERLHLQFYITKLESNEKNSEMAVELLVEEMKSDGPFIPARKEMSSINRMLVGRGVALPIKDYSLKRDKILAIELKKQLEKQMESEGNVIEAYTQWYNNSDELESCPISEDDFDTISWKTFDIETTHTDELTERSSVTVLRAWLSPEPILQKKFIGTPTYVDDQCVIYLHSAKQESTLTAIERKLYEAYTNKKMARSDTEWSPGDLCVAQYHGNKKWYRGKVLRLLESDKIEVQFVDYGNIEECTIGSLKKTIALEHIPIQCTKCRVRDLVPDNDTEKWKTEDLDKIHGVIVDADCEIRVHEREEEMLIISITLLPNQFREEKVDLIDYLIMKYNLKIKGRSKDVNKNVIYNDFAITENSDQDTEDTEVSTCASEIPLMLLSESLDSETDLTSDALTMIVETMDEVSTISADESDETHENLKNDEKHENHENDGDDEDDENDTNETTDADNIEQPCVQESVISSTAKSSLYKNEKTYWPIPIPKDIDFIQVDFICFSPNAYVSLQLKENIHCQNLAAYHALYQHITNEIQESAEKQPKLKSFLPKTPCCAQFENMWCRCLILDTKQTSNSEKLKLKLFYVDFADEHCIESESQELYCFKDDWFASPAMGVKCKLWNLRPHINKYDQIKAIEAILKKTKVAKIKKNVKSIYYVELFEDEEQQININNSLIEAGFFEIIHKEE